MLKLAKQAVEGFVFLDCECIQKHALVSKC